MKGKVQTVLGEVDPSELGRTLTHEHFNAAINKVFYKPPMFRPQLADCDFKLETIGWIRQNPYSHRGNMFFEGSDVDQQVLEEVKRFKAAGGGSIVENTSNGLGRNVQLCKNIAKEAKTNIIVGTGYYVNNAQSAETLSSSVEQLAEVIRKEVTEGCIEDPSVKCGIIGEVGCSYPLTDFERRSLKASGEMESVLGCPVMIHPGRHHSCPEEIIRVFSEAGGNPKRTVMAHLDRTIHELDQLLEFAEFGSYLEFDLFGIETSVYQQNMAVAMPSDDQKIMRVKHLIDNGYGDRMLASHDIHTRHRLECFGGHGFCHLFNSVLPVMLLRGISQETIDKITISNAADWLTFTK